MKIALYIEDGLEQIVLTAQTDVEQNLLSKLSSKRNLSIYKGSFYPCQGGWIRQKDYSDDSSTILVFNEKNNVQPS